jgi:acyl dehydratase
MMSLFFDDLEIGQRFETAGRTVTEADVVAFAGISGDFNELHTNEEMMRSSQFGTRIAHGALILSMVTGLRAQLGTFKDTIIAFVEIRRWRFVAPVFFGDTIRVVSIVQEMKPSSSKPDRGIVVHGIEVFNQRGELVNEGEMVNMLKRRVAG